MSSTKSINPYHAKKKNRPQLENEAITSRLENLLTPAIAAQKSYYRQLKLRDRILNLPLMVAAVLTLLWRVVAGLTELTRLLNRERFLWCDSPKIKQQALSQIFLTFSAVLFERIFKELLPHLRNRWSLRSSRPLPESREFTLKRFKRIWISDGSTLEALFCQLKSLEDVPLGKLAGKMGTLMDESDSSADRNLVLDQPKASRYSLEDLLNRVQANSLLLLDRGLYYLFTIIN
jgi:hypothetical protein